MIEGVILRKLRVIPDERGRLMEIFRCDDPEFRKFGQVYITTNYPGVVKAWHYHELQRDNVACLKGMIKLVLYDGRSGSATQGEVNEFFIGEHNPALIVIPPNVFHGWKCVSESESIVVNIPSEKYDYHNPDEHRLPFDTDEIPYNWDIVMK
ncbi:MAG: dTDP-4-dehydrorhamnose 3,5-epimerase family protein [candidate division Zixibacteria bacterium]|nr:dTDP-4-dehydrorhamnose 3,5-epimerase family protein [Candidatus Tariuqbacter arcticus]